MARRSLRWARIRWTMVLVVLGACSGGYGWSEASLTVDADGAQTVEFGLGRCMGGNPYTLDVRQTDDEIRIGVDGDWSDGDDCAFADVVALDEPLGDRGVVLTGPNHRYQACEDGPGAGADTPPGWQSLCREGETTAQTSPVFSRSPFEGLWIVEGATPPVWMELTHTEGPGSFRLEGSAGCNVVVVDVTADGGGGWLPPESSISELACLDPADAAERGVLGATGPVVVDEWQERVTLGPDVALVWVNDFDSAGQPVDRPADADEAGSWELDAVGVSVELPSAASCWSLGRWWQGAFTFVAVLADGEPFGVQVGDVAFVDEQDAHEAGAGCGETDDEPELLRLPAGMAAPGAYEVCDGGGLSTQTCHRFTVVEPGVAPPPIREIRAELAGIVVEYDGLCRSGVPEADGAAVITQDPINGRCLELARLRDVTEDIVDIVRAGRPDEPAPGLVLDVDGVGTVDELLAAHGAVALLVDDDVIAVVREPLAGTASDKIVVDSFFDGELGELERQLDG